MKILFEDSECVVADKPSGVLVHRTREAPDRETCMEILHAQYGGEKLYNVHRLDRGTSGALLLARNDESARALSRSFESREVEKAYLALVRGWTPESGVIDHALREEQGKEPAKAVTEFRRLAKAEFPKPVGKYPAARYSLVEARPLTGRRHQIRKHFVHLSHPLVGDTIYGEGRHNRFFREEFGVRRLLLHAWRLEFPHPRTGERISVSAPLGEDFQKVLGQLGISL